MRGLKLVCGLMLVALAGCRGKPGADGGAGVAVRDTAPSNPGHHIPVDSTKPTIQRPIIRDTAPGVTAGGTATVAHLLNSGDLVGKLVQVTGTCLGYRVPPVAAGSPPRTRSDWQLEASGQAIYVTGPLPPGCSATAGSSAPVTIVARVLEDTLAALGGNPPRPRRYLEWKGP